MQDTILQITIAGAAFGTGFISAGFVIAILRPSSYDDAWKDGYDNGVADAKEDALNTPAIWRKAATPRRRHTDGRRER